MFKELLWEEYDYSYRSYIELGSSAVNDEGKICSRKLYTGHSVWMCSELRVGYRDDGEPIYNYNVWLAYKNDHCIGFYFTVEEAMNICWDNHVSELKIYLKD